MIGLTEILILVFVLAIGGWCVYRGIRAIRDRFSSEEKATIFTYVNECAAALTEFAFGAAIVVAALWSLSGLLGFGNVGKPANNPPPTKTSLNKPDEVLQHLVGNWEVAAEIEGKTRIIGSAISIKLGTEPWVVTQLLDEKGELVDLVATGFDARTSTFNKYEVGAGSQSRHLVGVWVEAERAFKWSTEGTEEGATATEVFGDNSITVTESKGSGDSTVTQLSWFHRTPDFQWQSPTPSPLDGLAGRWSVRSVLKAKGYDPAEKAGTGIIHRESGLPLFIELKFKERSGPLAGVYIVDCRDARLRKRWFTNDGKRFEISGSPTPDGKGIDWSASFADGHRYEIADRIQDNDAFTSSFKLLNKEGQLEASSVAELQRVK